MGSRQSACNVKKTQAWLGSGPNKEKTRKIKAFDNVKTSKKYTVRELTLRRRYVNLFDYIKRIMLSSH